MSNKNLELWQSVCETDVKYTKKVSQRGGYTSIAPQYQAKVATASFGSYGEGWGLEESVFDKSIFEQTGVMIHNAVFFYMRDGKKSSFKITNSIEALNIKSGRFDTDAFKKCETNTISKALSKLGFSADVFMGEFDDINYFNEIQAAQGNAKQTEYEEKSIKLREELEVKVNVFFNKMKEAKNMTTLNAVTTTYKNQIIRACNEAKMNNEAFVNKLGEIYNEVKTKLEGVAK